MNRNKLVPFQSNNQIVTCLSKMPDDVDVVVVFSCREEVVEFSEHYTGDKKIAILSNDGFSLDCVKVYLTTPQDFLSHYMLSILRSGRPKFAKDMMFIGVNIDEYLVTGSLQGTVIPVQGLVKSDNAKATKKLTEVVLQLLGLEAQKEFPFYKDHSFDKNNGVTYDNSFYESCDLAWKSLSPENDNFKDNPGYYQFLSTVMFFVDALYTCHPEREYEIKDGRVHWVDGFKIKNFPLQQIIEGRHGIELSGVEPVSVHVSMAVILKNAKSLLVLSSTPEIYSDGIMDIYGIQDKSAYNTPLIDNKSVDYFVSESIMINTLFRRIVASDIRDCQFVVYVGNRTFHHDDFNETNVVLISSVSTNADYHKISKQKEVVLVYWDMPFTEVKETSVLRRVSFLADVVAVEYHLDPNNQSISSLPQDKRDGMLFAAQDGNNFFLKHYAKSKLGSASKSFQYDNRFKASDAWGESKLVVNSLFEHYESIRESVSLLHDMGLAEVSEHFNGVDITQDNLAEALKSLHIKIVLRLCVSSSYRDAVQLLNSTNTSLGKNVWNPSDVLKSALG